MNEDVRMLYIYRDPDQSFILEKLWHRKWHCFAMQCWGGAGKRGKHLATLFPVLTPLVTENAKNYLTKLGTFSGVWVNVGVDAVTF